MPGKSSTGKSSTEKTAGSRLDTYRAKRSASATPEPFGREGVDRPGLFVVQKHAARNLHYDLRIEVEGVLRSWAVPKGPSFDPADKRFAVETEDHPLEYADFEGVIPAGNYGAGAMIVWDRGLCVPRIDHLEGFEKGKLLFELRGFKLRGLWTLVKTKGEKEWLLIKERDGWASDKRVDDLGAESVFSGLTVEELRAGSTRAAEIRTRLEELGAPRDRVDPEKVKVMLAELRREAFSRKGWIFELKYDGYRLIASKERLKEGAKGRRRPARFFFRSGMDSTVSFPDLSRALRALPFESLVLDGEVTVLDEEAKPSFERLQKRGRLTRPRDAARAAVELPATYYAFDLLGFEDFDLRGLPLLARKEILRQVLPAAGPLRYADHVEERGEDVYAGVRGLGLEGMVAKKADAAYRAGRSANWLKVRADRTGDFAVVGFTRPKGGRTGFGALHIGVLEGERLAYAGSVGSGFAGPLLDELRARFEADQRPEPPVAGAVPRGAGNVWVEPRLVIEVRYTETTEAGHLRHPVFLRLRDDKRPEDCVRENAPPPEIDPGESLAADRPEVQFSNLDKIFWPEEGYTKGDLIDFYRAASTWLLPYLKDRPVVLDRYPDGIHGKNFYQKNAPDFAPDWIRTETVWTEEGGTETEYFVCDDQETLLYLANLGAIPLHVWSSRVDTLQAPDWSILDLDAKEAPFADVIEVARAIHRLCESIELPCFAKTSGATGLHVLIPLGGNCTYAQSKQLAEVLSRVVAEELKEIATIARVVAARQGRVYLDYLQNGYGKLLVSPLSARPRPGGTVSTPLAWDEVQPGLDPAAFTLKTVPERIERMQVDPLAEVLELAPDLPTILGRLAEKL
ncbi:MAG: DNA ligase D [bacterium]|nr:DNA ligase D [bacterium]